MIIIPDNVIQCYGYTSINNNTVDYHYSCSKNSFRCFHFNTWIIKDMWHGSDHK